MKYAWLTNLHLGSVKYQNRMEFYKEIKQANVDALLITGDTGTAVSVGFLLEEMAKCCGPIQIYFVFGNKDYWLGSINDMRPKWVGKSTRLLRMDPRKPACRYVGVPLDSAHLQASDGIGIVGVDGWGDGHEGNWKSGTRTPHNFFYIWEIAQAYKSPPAARIEALEEAMGPVRFPNTTAHDFCAKENAFMMARSFAQKDAQTLKISLDDCVRKGLKKIIVLTHVAPFKENVKLTERSNLSWLKTLYPSLVCKATGDVLLEVAAANPDIQFLCLCGTSFECMPTKYQPLSNLLVKSGEIRLGENGEEKPVIQEIIEMENS